MANTTSGSTSLTFTLGSYLSDSLSGSMSSSVAGDDFVKMTQLVPTSTTALSIGNLSTLGAYLIKNLDTTNYVDILSSTTGITILHLLPSSSAVGYFPGTITAPAAKANTSPVSIEYMICEV